MEAVRPKPKSRLLAMKERLRHKHKAKPAGENATQGEVILPAEDTDSSVHTRIPKSNSGSGISTQVKQNGHHIPSTRHGIKRSRTFDGDLQVSVSNPVSSSNDGGIPKTRAGCLVKTKSIESGLRLGKMEGGTNSGRTVTRTHTMTERCDRVESGSSRRDAAVAVPIEHKRRTMQYRPIDRPRERVLPPSPQQMTSSSSTSLNKKAIDNGEGANYVEQVRIPKKYEVDKPNKGPSQRPTNLPLPGQSSLNQNRPPLSYNPQQQQLQKAPPRTSDGNPYKQNGPSKCPRNPQHLEAHELALGFASSSATQSDCTSTRLREKNSQTGESCRHQVPSLNHRHSRSLENLLSYAYEDDVTENNFLNRRATVANVPVLMERKSSLPGGISRNHSQELKISEEDLRRCDQGHGSRAPPRNAPQPPPKPDRTHHPGWRGNGSQFDPPHLNPAWHKMESDPNLYGTYNVRMGLHSSHASLDARIPSTARQSDAVGSRAVGGLVDGAPSYNTLQNIHEGLQFGRRNARHSAAAKDGRSAGLRPTNPSDVQYMHTNSNGLCPHQQSATMTTPRRHTVTVGGMDVETAMHEHRHQLQAKKVERQKEGVYDYLAHRYPHYADTIRPRNARDQHIYGQISVDQHTLQRRPVTTGHGPAEATAPTTTGAPVGGGRGPPDQEDRLSTQSEADTSPTGGGFRRGGRLRNSLPVVRSPNRSMERPMGQVFLIYHNETKRAVLPNEVTSLLTVQALFVRAFPEHLHLNSFENPNCKIYIQDHGSKVFYELEVLRDVMDGSVLKIYRRDPTGLPPPPPSPLRSPGPKGRDLPAGAFYNPYDSDSGQRSANRSPVHHPITTSPRSYNADVPVSMASSMPPQSSLASYHPTEPHYQCIPARVASTDNTAVQHHGPQPPCWSPGQRPRSGVIYGTAPSRSNQSSPQRTMPPMHPAGAPVNSQRLSASCLPDAITHNGIPIPPGIQAFLDYQDPGSSSPRSGSTTPRPEEAKERMAKMENELASLKAWLESADMYKQLPPSSVTSIISESSCSGKSKSESPTPTLQSPTSSGQQGMSDISSTTPQPFYSVDLQRNLSVIHLKAMDLRVELTKLRRLQMSNQEAMKDSIKQTLVKIKEAVSSAPGIDGKLVQRQHDAASGAMQVYRADGKQVENDLIDLEKAVEELRQDVLERKCRVNMTEVESMALALSSISKALAQLKSRFPDLSTKMKTAMSAELEMVVKDEKFIREEPDHIDASLKRCKKLTGILFTLKRLSSVQEQKPPSVPTINTEEVPCEEDRKALLSHIEAMVPDHKGRLTSLQAADEKRERKKRLTINSDAMKFSKSIEMAQMQLRETHNMTANERRQERLLNELVNSEHGADTRRPTSQPTVQSRKAMLEGKVSGEEKHGDGADSPDACEDHPYYEEVTNTIKRQPASKGSKAEPKGTLQTADKPNSKSKPVMCKTETAGQNKAVEAQSAAKSNVDNKKAQLGESKQPSSTRDSPTATTKSAGDVKDKVCVEKDRSGSGKQVKTDPIKTLAGVNEKSCGVKTCDGGDSAAADMMETSCEGGGDDSVVNISTVSAVLPVSNNNPIHVRLSTFEPLPTTSTSDNKPHLSLLPTTSTPKVQAHVTFSGTVTEIHPSGGTVGKTKKIPPPPPPRKGSTRSILLSPQGAKTAVDDDMIGPHTYENFESVKKKQLEMASLGKPPNKPDRPKSVEVVPREKSTPPTTRPKSAFVTGSGIYANTNGSDSCGGGNTGGVQKNGKPGTQSMTGVESHKGNCNKNNGSSKDGKNQNGRSVIPQPKDMKKVPPPPPVRKTCGHHGDGGNCGEAGTLTSSSKLPQRQTLPHCNCQHTASRAAQKVSSSSAIPMLAGSSKVSPSNCDTIVKNTKASKAGSSESNGEENSVSKAVKKFEETDIY